MREFEPRQVSPEAWRSWCRQALELQSRVWVRQLLVAAMTMAGLVLFNMFGHWMLNFILMIMIAPLLIAIFILVSTRADGEKWQLPGGRQRFALVCRLVFSGVLGWFVMLLLLVVIVYGFSLWQDSTGAAAGRTRAAGQAVDAGLAWPHLFYTGLLLILLPLMAFYAQSLLPRLSIWFCLPLLLHNGLDLVTAFRLSRHAEQLNWSATNMVTMISLAALGLVLISGGILAMVVLPFLGALHYVSYRDVFMAINENAPLPASQPEIAGCSTPNPGHTKFQQTDWRRSQRSGSPGDLNEIHFVRKIQVSTNTVHKVVDK